MSATDREIDYPGDIELLRQMLPSRLAGMTDFEIQDAYRAYSGHYWPAGWMSVESAEADEMDLFRTYLDKNKIGVR